jgi:predicted double-glycine peptidase
MFPNWFGLSCAVLALVLFVVAHRRALAMSTRTRWRWFALTVILALPAGYNALYYLHWLPEAAWFYEVRSWRGVEALVIPVGAAGGFWAALLHRRMLVLPLLATVGVAWGPFLKPIFGPVKVDSLHDTWTHDVCIQSTLSSCGPASTATVLKASGVATQEGEIVRAAHTYMGGTEAWYLARYIRSRGLRARFVMSGSGFPDAVQLPAIVGVTVGGRGHFIALTSRTGDVFDVGDPMNGPEKLTRVALEHRYNFTGFVLEVSRSEPAM